MERAWRTQQRKSNESDPIDRLPNDPADDHVIACAIAARADAIASGDHHLLDLGDEYQGIAILTASQALMRIA